MFKRKNEITDNEETLSKVEIDQYLLTETDAAESQEDQEFNNFFAEVLSKFPKRTSEIILKTFNASKNQAEKLLSSSQSQYSKVVDEFLSGVDKSIKNKCHQTIHFAALSAAIIGFSPIPFSDSFLLVPVQLTMMARLHKIFGQSWSESLGKSLTKELVVVSFGKSIVGNVWKLVPGLGTVAGGVINASVAVAITEALGWVTVKMLNDGEDIFDDVMSFRGQFGILFKALQKSRKS